MMPPDGERERLGLTIAAAGYCCVECGTRRVTAEHDPALGWVPVVHHHRVRRWRWWQRRWCPATYPGTVAAWRASLDLLDALVSVVTVADYGELVRHRRERVSA
jgi:hypothetical protein